MQRSIGRWRFGRSFFAVLVASLAFASSAFAAALVQDLKGDVRTSEAAAAVEKGQRILTGATLTTGASSQATLVFDDGQQIVLNENTRLAITDYRFAKGSPQDDRSFLNLLSGAARIVTGELAQRSRSVFEFRTPTSTIGIRGTDFIVAIVEQPSYLNVLQGEIAATNVAGTVAFGAGSFGMISAATVLAVAIPAIALPAAAAAAFSSLGSVAVSVGAAAGATGGAVGGAAGAVGIGTVAAVGAGVAAVGAVASNSSSSSGGGSSSNSSTSSTTSATTGANPFAGAVHGTYSSSVSGTSSGVAISGGCNGTWSGTIDSAGNYSGTLIINTCTGNVGGTSTTTKVAGTYPDSGTIDSAGNIVGTAYSSSSSGITVSCTSGKGTVTATTVNVTSSCTVSGAVTGCTGSCSINLTSTETLTGTRP